MTSFDGEQALSQAIQLITKRTTLKYEKDFLFYKKVVPCSEMDNYLSEQELRQAGHYTPMASNKMQHINWLLYNSALRI